MQGFLEEHYNLKLYDHSQVILAFWDMCSIFKIEENVTIASLQTF